MSYKKRLQQLEGDFNDADTMSGGGGVPEGDYQLLLKETPVAEIQKGKRKGKLGITLKFVVAVGQYKGEKVPPQFFCLEDETSVAIFKGILETAGVNLKTFKLRNLDKVLKDHLLDQVFECRVDRNGRYTNVYVNGTVDALDDEDEDEIDDEEEEEEEEKPKRTKKKAKKKKKATKKKAAPRRKKTPAPEEDEDDDEEDDEEPWDDDDDDGEEDWEE